MNGKICYSVGYNIDMLETAPTAALTSATNNWAVYYKHAIATVMGGGDLEQDWSAGYNDDAVGITELGESCAEGTADYVADIESKLKDGSLQVICTSTFTVGGDESYFCIRLTFPSWITQLIQQLLYIRARLLRQSWMDILQSPHSEALHTLHFVLMESQRTQTLLISSNAKSCEHVSVHRGAGSWEET